MSYNYLLAAYYSKILSFIVWKGLDNFTCLMDMEDNYSLFL
jgi:hypothetical protein